MAVAIVESREISRLEEYLSTHPSSIHEKDEYGLSLLHIAAENGFLDVLSVLIHKGGKINEVDSQGAAPLHYACKEGHTSAASLLLENGASLSPDNYGLNPLHYCVKHGHVDTAKLLLDQGHRDLADLPDTYGWTPLHLAVANKKQNCVDLLLKYGANARLKDHHGKSCLDLAKEKDCLELVELFSNLERQK